MLLSCMLLCWHPSILYISIPFQIPIQGKLRLNGLVYAKKVQMGEMITVRCIYYLGKFYKMLAISL